MSPSAERTSPKRTTKSPRSRTPAKSITAGKTGVGTRKAGSTTPAASATPVVLSPEEPVISSEEDASLLQEKSMPRSRSYAPPAPQFQPEPQPPVQEAPTFELLLAASGYLPIKKILTEEETPSGPESMLRYIKALNADGHIVYVIPDTEGVSVVRSDEKVFKLNQEGNEIPYATKAGALQCVDGLCTVLIECGEGQVCAVATDKTTNEPIERTLVVSTGEYGGDPADAYAYPVVKLSDIMKNAQAVNHSIAKTSMRFRQLNNQMARDGFQQLQQALEGVQNEVSGFVPTYLRAIRDLSESSAQLANLRIAHRNAPPSQDQEEKLRMIGYNISVRSDMLHEILNMGAELEALALQMEDVKRTVASRTAYLQEKYASLGKVYTQD